MFWGKLNFLMNGQCLDLFYKIVWFWLFEFWGIWISCDSFWLKWARFWRISLCRRGTCVLLKKIKILILSSWTNWVYFLLRVWIRIKFTWIIEVIGHFLIPTKFYYKGIILFLFKNLTYLIKLSVLSDIFLEAN